MARADAPTPPVVCRDLRKRYGERVAVDGVGFEVAAGETYGLLGPNGAGKTTTIAMLCGITARDGGEVLVCGQPVDVDRPAAKAALGYVPQEIALYPDLTARENLAFFGRIQGLRRAGLREAVDAALDAVGLTERADERVERYSGGMQRRLNIAAGTLHRPRVLVLDEPTVGVDPQSRYAILESVAALGAEGLAVVYTTHYMEEAERLCDRVGVIDEGRIVAEGTRDELLGAIGARDRVVLRVGDTDRGRVSALADRCRALAGVGGATATDGTVEVLADRAGALVAGLVASAEAEGVTLDGLEVVRPDLEAVFLHLTGKALRD